MTPNLNDLQELLEGNLPKLDLSQYSYLPSIKYRDKITKLCKTDLLKDIDNYTACLILNNNQKLLLSNNVNASTPYMIYGLHRGDMYWWKDSYQIGIDHDFPSQVPADNIQQLVRSYLQNRYGVYHTYRVIRLSFDVVLLFACILNSPPERPELIYDKTIDNLEEFTVYFFDNMIEECIHELPMLKLTRFATDVDYRKRFIKDRHQSAAHTLSPRE
ncbi:MAG: hypothetical protein KIT27_12025, partial [Legionellales bacterium]|nr:hypothetical protein [Legionellales bacterium]